MLQYIKLPKYQTEIDSAKVVKETATIRGSKPICRRNSGTIGFILSQVNLVNVSVRLGK